MVKEFNMSFEQMTVGELKKRLQLYDDNHPIVMSQRISRGTALTSINHVGLDKHGNLIISFDDDLLNAPAKHKV
jgi:hypothetical protein